MDIKEKMSCLLGEFFNAYPVKPKDLMRHYKIYVNFNEWEEPYSVGTFLPSNSEDDDKYAEALASFLNASLKGYEFISDRKFDKGHRLKVNDINIVRDDLEKKIDIRKKILIPILLLCGIAFGGVVQAGWHPIPGIDEPFDPPNYYSLTSISIPDSAPSIFTLRDLEEQGGSVYDYERHLKNIDVVQNLTDWLSQALEMLGIRIKNKEPLDSTILHATKSGIDKLNADTQQNWLGSEANSFLQGTLFRSYDRYDEDSNTYSKQAQYQKAAEMYKSYAASAKAVLETQEQEQAVIDRIMSASSTAMGEMQIEQARVQIEAVQSAENARRDMLLGNIASLKAVEDAIQADEDIEYFRQVEAAQIQIQDPYDRTELEKKQYDRPTGKGFMEFKQ